ncbi:MAG: hypothetical protein J6B93_04325 [Clostridia bacterium]|nr:hypothetical protein [Clostridia bacterium]
MNKKSVKIWLIVVASLTVALLAATIILWPTLWKKVDPDTIPGTVIFGSESDKINGYADVTLYGAKADDGKDDTAAFKKAAETGAGVYVPLGTFEIKETVTLRGQNFKGAGMDRTVLRFGGKGTIVDAKGAAVIEDMTLTFGENDIKGDETEGQQVAIKNSGMTGGAMIKAVRLINIGTGLYSPLEDVEMNAFTVESLIVQKFSYKAIQMKDAASTIFRTTRIGESLGEVDAAVSMTGSFTLDQISFFSTTCKYALELKDCESAIVNTVLFEGVAPTSGSLIKVENSAFTFRSAAVKTCTAQNLIALEDGAEGACSTGKVNLLWTDGKIAVDAQNKIPCDSSKSQ